jgi:long-chain fatty acid transport protein
MRKIGRCSVAKHSKLLVGSLLTLLALPTGVFATFGYIPHGFGTASKGMAGAGSALPQDTLTVYLNPAGLARVGKRLDVTLSFFNPEREYRANDDGAPPPFPSVPAGTFDSRNDLFFIPGFGMSWRLGEKGTMGITLTAHGGMNTEYNTSTFERFAAPPGSPQNPTGEFTAGEPTGVDLVQLVGGLTYAHQLTPNHAVGITPLFAVQRFKAQGLQPFKQFSASPNDVTNNGYDYSYGGGLRIGWLGTLHERLDVGVSYQTRLWMSDLNEYKGLFAKGGEFDLPPILNVGVALRIHPKLTLVADYQRIFYNEIDALSNSNDIPTSDILTDPDKRLGADKGLGFGWSNVNIIKVGLQYEHNDKWIFRVGYSHGEEPWEDVNTLFNVLAPATVQDHLACGFTYRINKKSEVVFAFTHGFKNTIQGQSTFTGPQTGHVRMHQNDLEIGWAYLF